MDSARQGGFTLTPAFNTCVFESNKYCWITCIFAFTWLRWHQKDLKLNTRNKRTLALEKTNGPYAWLHQTSPPSLVWIQNSLYLQSLCVGILFNSTALGITQNVTTFTISKRGLVPMLVWRKRALRAIWRERTRLTSSELWAGAISKA